MPLSVLEKYRKQYRSCLDGSKPCAVILKRRLDRRGYDDKVVIPIEPPTIPEPERVMAPDINSGRIDFAVVDKQTGAPRVFSRINCSILLDARRGKKQLLTHKLVNKVGNIAKHCRAEVLAGKLNTTHCKGHRHTNRKAQGMNQCRIWQFLRYKVPLRGIPYRDMSEAYTSQIGRKLSRPESLRKGLFKICDHNQVDVGRHLLGDC